MFYKTATRVQQFLGIRKAENKKDPCDKLLKTEIDKYSDVIVLMKEIYKTLPSLPSTLMVKRQVLIAGAIGAGCGLLTS